jgi:hypothetical protein
MSLCLTPVNQVESGAVGLLPFMRQSQEPSGYLSHHFIDHVIAWSYAARLPNNLTNPTVYRGNWKQRNLQSQGFHYF